ncbi:MAG TPA: zinc-ribbon domain-containing protein [Candidatus Hydrogenedens sp.]|nr:zinc-ribbon domain-containing protein [Candidatus Hydrogenedens sp.]
MFCTECGNTIREGATFCPNCGTKIGETLQMIDTPTIKPDKKKSMGIVFVTICCAIYGFVLIIAYLVLSFMYGVAVSIPSEIIRELPIGVNKTLQIIGIGIIVELIFICGIFYTTATYGIWNLKEWGRILAIVMLILSLVVDCLSEVLKLGIIGFLFSIIIDIQKFAMIFYLCIPSVKKQFQ